MRKIIFILLVVTNFIYSQDGIGTTTPRGALEINSSDLGMILPNVSLTSLSASSPVINPTGGALLEGTLVWNTNTISGVLYPGYYYWGNSQWNKVAIKAEELTSIFSSPAEPNLYIGGSASSFSSGGVNSSSVSFDNSTQNRVINVSGFAGLLVGVKCTVILNHSWGSDIDLYLQSPNGQIIELSTDNGGTSSTSFNVLFDDTASLNITTWTGGNISGSYRPEGSLAPSGGVTPNITTMSGFNGYSPNGNWTLIARDDAGGDTFNFISYELEFSTLIPVNYRLLAEISFVYNSLNNYSILGNYSGNCSNNQGIITAISLTTSSVGSVGTEISSLGGTVLSYAADSPYSSGGWCSTMNSCNLSSLTNNVTYYIQYWVKGVINTPFNSNENFALIPKLN